MTSKDDAAAIWRQLQVTLKALAQFNNSLEELKAIPPKKQEEWLREMLLDAYQNIIQELTEKAVALRKELDESAQGV